MRNLLISLRSFLLHTLKPFLEWASGKHLPFTHKGVTGKDYFRAIPLLRPGMIFLTKIRGELTSVIIPGYWSHAAIYAPVEGVIGQMVMEAEGPGVIQTDLITFMTTKDEILVLAPYASDKCMELAAKYATGQLGMPYDYDLDFHMTGQKAFYCSELVWWAYEMACDELGEECPFSVQTELGVETVSPDNIANAKNFSVVYDSRKWK